MANKSWKTAVDGFWSVSTNWNPSLPTSVDIALINLAGVYTVTLDIDQVLGGLTLGGTASGTQTLAIAGNTLTLNGASTVGNNGVLALSGGTITGTGALTVSGTGKLNWSDGTISGTGKKTISGALNLSGYQSLDGTTLETSGATIWTGAYLYGYNGAIWNNTSTGTIDLQGDADFYLGSGTPSFNNAGTFTKSNGATNEESYFNVVFNNTGTVNVKKGTLRLANGGTNTKTFSIDTGATLKIYGIDYNFNTGSSLTGVGNLVVESAAIKSSSGFNSTAAISLNYGTLDIGGASTWSGSLAITGGSTVKIAAASTLSGAVTLAGGTLTGAGDLTLSNQLTWSDGTISGTGKKTISGALNLSGYQSLDGTTLETSGATIWTGAGYLYGYNGAIWNNTSTGTIDLQGDADFYLGSGTPSFNNAGTFTKSNGATNGSDYSDFFGVAFNNTGTVNVKKGTLNLAGGGTNTKTFSIDTGAILTIYNVDYNFNTGSSITGVGNLVVGGATLKSSSGFNSTAAISVNNGTLDIGGASTWSSSLAITGGSTVKIAAASTLSGAVTLTDGTLTGAGALTLSNQLNWSSGTIISGTGKKTVSGALNLSGYQSLDGTTLETSGATIWTGAGYLYSYNGAIWNNTSTGTIDLQGDADFYLGSGTPSFNNAGTFTKSNGATNDESYFNVVFNNTGTVNVKKGTLNLAGGGTNSKTFSIDTGAILKITNDYNFNTGNSVAGAGILSLEYSTVAVSAASTWSAPIVINGGTLSGTGALIISNKLTWNNGTISGTGKKTVSGALNLTNGDGYLGGTTLETTGATIWTGTSRIFGVNGGVWNNTSTGTIDLQGDGDFIYSSGTAVTFNNAGTFSKSNGATDGSDNSYFSIIVNNTGTIDVKKGALIFDGGYTQTAGTTRLSGGNLTLNYYNATGFDLKGGVLTGAGTITGNVNNTGGQVNPGNTVGTLVIAGNYSQSGTGLLNFDLASAASFDQFNVSGEGTFGGTLKVTLGTGYTPTIGTKFTVLTYGTATTKTFNTVQGIDLSTSLALAPSSPGNNLILEVVDKVPDLGAVSFGNTKSFTDAVGDSDLFDFYRFNVSAADIVQLKLTNLTANADIWLVDGLGRTLAQGTQTGTADEAISWAVYAGTYFVKVFRPAAGNNTNYTLQVATTSIPAVITVAATDASAAETATGVTANPGTFTLTRTGDLSQAITVNYTLAGTATNGTDYTNLPLTANFVAGASTALVTVTPTDDALAEATENVVLTLATGTGYSLGTAINATVNIADNETPVVTIAATDASAAETATGVTPNPGTFTLTRLGNLASALTVNYTVTGTATNGTDYTSLPLTATFAAGASTALVTVTPTDDSLAEATENVVLTLATGTGYSLGTTTSATVNIADNETPVVTIAATDASAAETATGVTANPGTFTLTRLGNLASALTVNYTVTGSATNGTDYTNIPLSATFLAGASTALVTVTPTDDALAEATENVVLTLTTGTGYNLGTTTSATVNIADNETPVVTIAATDASAAETATGVTANPGTFTLTRLGNLASALTVNYTVTGSATNGTDYTTLPLTATFAAGASTAVVTVTPTDDTLAEATENVVLTLATGTGYSLGTTTSATVNIADNETPVITVAATDASAAETATGVTPNPGTFTLTRLGNLASALTVNYTVTGSATNGTDYTTLPLTATFAAGASTVLVTVTPTDDTVAESSETATLTLATGTGYSLGTTTSATVNIADNETPVITVAATDASAAETATGVTPNPGTFTLTRLGNLASALTVNYTLAGTATNGTDYTTIPLTATFAAGSNTALVNVSPIDDSSFEGTETVILNLGTGTGYTLGTTASATVNIDDNDTAGSAEITVSATDASAAETATGVTPNPGTFTFARTGNTVSALTVNYTLSGTAINGSDYTSLVGTVTFAANASTATVNVNPLDDTIFETSTPETVILTLATGTGYTLGSATTGTVSITDNDIQPVINLSASQTVVEGFTSPQTVSYTVTLANASSQTITVNYATANGTALAGSDYTSTSGILTFNAGVTSQVINIPILNDSLNETNETFTLSLTSPTNATLGTSTVTTTITDTLTASVTTTLPANVENLTLTGTAVANGTGNAGANVLTGNSANNILAGLDGNDTYVFVANSLLGIDTINETTTGGTDTLDFTGTNSPIRLNLGVTTNQTVVTSNLTLKLSAIDGIENVYGGNGSDRLTGNNLNNALYGNGGADSLSGGGGADSLVGGAGDDLLGGGAGNDSFVYSTGKAFLNTDLGLDTLLDFTTTADKLVLSKATFTALTSAIGNGFSQGTEFAIVDDDALAGGSSAFIVYSSNSGSLFYNQNGNASGLGTGAEFAVLFGIPTLSSGDFSLAA